MIVMQRARKHSDDQEAKSVRRKIVGEKNGRTYFDMPTHTHAHIYYYGNMVLLLLLA